MTAEVLEGGEYRGRYIVRRQIGSGGTSNVYLLHDLRLRRDVVLKKGVTRGRYTHQILGAVFANEQRILTLLNGHYAPICFDFFADDLELYMEYCPGRTLDSYLEEWISKNNFPSDDVLLRLVQVLVEAVEACHRKGVIIADLKPRNIQIGSRSQDTPFSVTLLDFGSGWIVGSSDPRPIADYTAGYGAPETLRGETPTHASDIYSLGAILFALFERREPSLYVSPRSFVARRRAVLPEIQNLVLRLTDDDPARRPSIEEVSKTLRECQEELQELIRATGGQCPSCNRAVVSASARFCPHCGAPLIRQTQVLPERTASPHQADARVRFLQYVQAGDYISAVFWAKHAFELNQLSVSDRVLALEVAIHVPGDCKFARQLASSISLDNLQDKLDKRKYLVLLGELLAGPDRFRPNRDQLMPYRERYEEAVQEWPDEEKLWWWLCLASDDTRQEDILRRGLTYHPESSRIRIYLGRAQYQRRAIHEALATWFDAVQKGERDLHFVQAVYRLAHELQDKRRGDVLREILLGTEPHTSQEAMILAKFALEEGRISKAIHFVELGLSQDPYNSDLRQLKAKILYDQHKYELCLELDWVREPGDDHRLRELKGLCLFNLKRYAEAAQEMCNLIAEGYGTHETWICLIRCYRGLNKLRHADEALAQALRLFPNDDRLQQFARTMRK